MGPPLVKMTRHPPPPTDTHILLQMLDEHALLYIADTCTKEEVPVSVKRHEVNLKWLTIKIINLNFNIN